MHIKPYYEPMKDLLTRTFFFIPRFQRPYSWEDQHIEEFWRDCIEDDGESEHFIGSLVFFKEGEKYGIVDGQQRLTTVTMILCALRNEFRNQNLNDLADGLNQLIVRPNINNKLQPVLQSESTIPYFQSAIQQVPGTHVETAESIEEKRLSNAFTFIESKLRAIVSGLRPKIILKKLETIRNRVLKLMTVALIMDNDEDAYVIFETLNTRGKDLELGDLIRTHLTKCMPSGNATTDPVRSKFDALRKDFDRAARKLDDFILHFWLSRYDYTAKKKIYKNLKRTVKHSNAREFFDRFLKDGKYYLDLTYPSRRKWAKDELSLAESLDALRIFRVEQPNPFVLAVGRAFFERKITLKLTRRAISAVENFHFAFTAITSSRSSGGISQMYARHAREISNSTSPQEAANEVQNLIVKLREKRPHKEEFLAAFAELSASEKVTREKALVQYTLHKLAQYCSRSPIDKARMTIEHLAPQGGKSSGLSDEVLAAIGNLAWVSNETQDRLGTKRIDLKRTILAEDHCWIDDYLDGYSGEWNKKAIMARGLSLGELAYEKVWAI